MNNEDLIKFTTALNKIDELEKAHEENHAEIEGIKQRLSTYDVLAAKWGGMCMLAIGLGTLIVEFPDKLKILLGIKP